LGLDLEIETGFDHLHHGSKRRGKTTLRKSHHGLATNPKAARSPMKGAALNKQSAEKTRLIQALVMCLKGAIFFPMLTWKETLRIVCLCRVSVRQSSPKEVPEKILNSPRI